MCPSEHDNRLICTALHVQNLYTECPVMIVLRKFQYSKHKKKYCRILTVSAVRVTLKQNIKSETVTKIISPPPGLLVVILTAEEATPEEIKLPEVGGG